MCPITAGIPRSSAGDRTRRPSPIPAGAERSLGRDPLDTLRGESLGFEAEATVEVDVPRVILRGWIQHNTWQKQVRLGD